MTKPTFPIILGTTFIILVIYTVFHGGRHYEKNSDAKLPKTSESGFSRLEQQLGILTAKVEKLDAYKRFEWIYDIGIYDYHREHSQTYTDSILQFMFQNLGTTDKYYVEFGCEDGGQINTRYLREKQGWSGLLMDGGFDKPEINLHKEMITKSNVNHLFEKYNVPHEFDLLSVDVDYNTYWVWKAIDHKKYRPRVLVVEYNPDWAESYYSVPLSTEDCETCSWDMTEYQGANAPAMWKLGRDHGYTLVYMENLRVNLYFIRTDILGTQEFVDEFFPFKRVFRWGQLRANTEFSTKKPVIVNGLHG